MAGFYFSAAHAHAARAMMKKMLKNQQIPSSRPSSGRPNPLPFHACCCCRSTIMNRPGDVDMS